MNQNIEIEFKNMLTMEEYKKLLREFQINEAMINTQENHYFDTVDFSLKEKGVALRIRKKNDDYEMTLKQPATVGLLETNQELTKEEAMHAIQNGKLPSGTIEEVIAEMGIPFSHVINFGSLKTDRAEINYMTGLLVLDHSYYLNKEDFELEYEVADEKQGLIIFEELLALHGIPLRRTENKIQRFYQQKYSPSN